ncbi:MAG: 16S rRNA (guanine(527)-N(7))-methyltransferase RsmG [Lachnospirales bacterium]
MKNIVKNYFEKLGLNISDNMASQFEIYKNLLVKWNEVMNLTAITEDREVCIKHFADSVTPLLHYDFKDKKVIDVGTGAGFPGLPIKICESECDMVLIDSLKKRINFLEEVASKCNLSLKCVHGRAEDFGQDENFREVFDIALSRAVAPLNILCEYDLPYVKVGGVFIALKGPNVYEEIENSKNAINILGGEISDIIEVNLPETDLNHNIIIIKKVAETPQKYPRRAKKIERSPL